MEHVQYIFARYQQVICQRTSVARAFYTLHYGSTKGFISDKKLIHSHLCCKTSMQTSYGLTDWTGNSPYN